MEIDRIIFEIYTLFDDSALIKFLIVNKKLNSVITIHFQSKLKIRHQQCIKLGDTIDLNSFCNYFMKMLTYKSSDKNTSDLSYDYCSDCYSFGLQKIDVNNSLNICEFGCTIVCCGKTNTVPPSYVDDIQLECGCYVTTKIYTNIKIKMCQCGTMVTDTTIKCTKCGKIPLKSSPIDFLSTSSDDFFFTSSDEDDFLSTSSDDEFLP